MVTRTLAFRCSLYFPNHVCEGTVVLCSSLCQAMSTILQSFVYKSNLKFPSLPRGAFSTYLCMWLCCAIGLITMFDSKCTTVVLRHHQLALHQWCGGLFFATCHLEHKLPVSPDKLPQRHWKNFTLLPSPSNFFEVRRHTNSYNEKNCA